MERITRFVFSALIFVVAGCGSSANNKETGESNKRDPDVEILFDGVWCCGYQPIDEQDAAGVHIEGVADHFVQFNSATNTFNAVCQVMYLSPVEIGFIIKWHGTWSANEKTLTEVTEKENVELKFDSEQIDSRINVEGIKDKYIGLIVGKVVREIRDKEIMPDFKRRMMSFTLFDGKKVMVYTEPDGELAEVADYYFHISIFGRNETTENEEYINEKEVLSTEYVPYPNDSAIVVIDTKGKYVGDFRCKEGDKIFCSIGDNEWSMSTNKCKVVTYKAKDGQGVVCHNQVDSNKIVNIYLKSNLNSKIIGHIYRPEGYPEDYPCLGTEGAFYKIKYKGKIGYVEKNKVQWWTIGF